MKKNKLNKIKLLSGEILDGRSNILRLITIHSTFLLLLTEISIDYHTLMNNQKFQKRYHRPIKW